MLIDIAIIILAIGSFYRGREVGLVRQLCSTIGFFGGLFIGSVWLSPHTLDLVHTQGNRALVTLVTTLGTALVLLSIGEYVGLHLKRFVTLKNFSFVDDSLGGILSVVSLLFSIWLVAAIVGASPFPGLQSTLRSSYIVSRLDRTWPQAPNVLADLGHLIDPNGFPQVFIGNEPTPPANINLPSLGDLQTAVSKDQVSVVKIVGQGCGGTVSGSGFVVGPNLVATNAHVVAGIAAPYIQDKNGTHSGTVLWFDPNFDFAVLSVGNLAGPALPIDTTHFNASTPAAAMGYPDGGPLTAGSAAILDEFTAIGRNIYGNGNTQRDVYEIRAHIIPGNSGGPLVDTQGKVIGVVFAQSTTYQNVGYALQAYQVSSEIQQAQKHNHPVSTGKCAD